MLVPRSSDTPAYSSWWERCLIHECVVPEAIQDIVLPRMAATGRLAWLLDTSLPVEEARILSWDDGPLWQPQVRITRDDKARHWTLQGELVRGESTASMEDAVLVLRSGLIIFPEIIVRFDATSGSWPGTFQRSPRIQVPYSDRAAFLDWFYRLPGMTQVVWPENLRVERTETMPRGRLVIKEPAGGFGKPRLLGDVTFQYDGAEFAMRDPRQGRFDAEQNRAICRNRTEERRLWIDCENSGFSRRVPELMTMRTSNSIRGISPPSSTAHGGRLGGGGRRTPDPPGRPFPVERFHER